MSPIGIARICWTFGICWLILTALALQATTTAKRLGVQTLGSLVVCASSALTAVIFFVLMELATGHPL